MILMVSMQYNSSPKKYREQGFTLLYAMIISSLVLATTLSIVNVAIKQKNISGLSQESQVAFYAANSGLECALYWALHGRTVALTSGALSIPVFKIPRGSNDNGNFASLYDSPLSDSDDHDRVSLLDNPVPSIDCFGENIVQNSSVYGFNTQYDFLPGGSPSLGDQWFDGLKGDQLSVTGATIGQLCGEGYINSDTLDPDEYRVWLFRLMMPDGGAVSSDDTCAEVAVCRRLDSASLSISSRGYNTCDINSSEIVERAVRLIQF